MKICNRILTTAVVAALTMGLSACGSDDDDDNDTPDTPNTPAEQVKPSNVFTAGMPKQVGDMNITTNEKGQVTKIVDGTTTTTFEYVGAGSRASVPAKYDMIMRTSDSEEGESFVFYITLKNGFISYAYEICSDQPSKPDEWWFEYNSASRMTKMKRSEGDNEVTAITYDKNGDITRVSLTDDKHPTPSVTEISYTDAGHKSPVANKGCVMLFDDTFDIDMDEMAPAYYAGLLGKATTNLPLSAKGSSWTKTFAWTLNASGLPTVLKTHTIWNDGYVGEDDLTNFVW